MRFLHSADWQLGMRRHFLGDDALPRFLQARIDAVRAMAELARSQRCAFAVVSGDVFESNQIDRRTLGRGVEALAAFPCPVFLLPGNHDPYDAGSIYRGRDLGKGVTVLRDGSVHEVAPGVQVVGAPWHSKRPRRDLVAEVLRGLEPLPGGIRVLVAHGPVTGFGDDVPERIDLGGAQRALDDGRIHYLALGDRHSTTEVAPRIWYGGSPEATDYDESDSGHALIVDLEGDRCTVTRHRVGRWTFLRRAFRLDGAADLDHFDAEVAALPSKDSTILKLSLEGALSVGEMARLEESLARAREVFAAVELWERRSDLHLRPDATELGALGLGGFARATAEELAARADDPAAQDALVLLYRLARGMPE